LVPIQTIAKDCRDFNNNSSPRHQPAQIDSRTLAIELMRPAYVQQFGLNVPEARGSIAPFLHVSLGGVRQLNMTSLHARLAALQRLGRS
jgi:hypothetical protein